METIRRVRSRRDELTAAVSDTDATGHGGAPPNLPRGKWALRLLAVLGVVAIVAAAAWSAVTLHDRYELHFGCVERGVLYRSAQPDRHDLQRLWKTYGIRTIVNLRSSSDVREDREAQDEVLYARGKGIRFVNISFNELGPDAASEAFLKIMEDRTNWPVLIHCAAGKERSGVLVAVYRIAIQGWTFDRALEEMIAYGFEPAKQAEMTRFVRDYASRRARETTH